MIPIHTIISVALGFCWRFREGLPLALLLAVLVAVLAEIAVFVALFSLFFLFLARVFFPAGADDDHEDGRDDEHDGVGELIHWNYAQVVFLALRYLLLNFLPQLLTLLSPLNAVDVFRVSTHILQQHFVELAGLIFCLKWCRNVHGSHNFLVGLGRCQILADERGYFENAVFASDSFHACFEQRQCAWFACVFLEISAHEPTAEKHLHSAPQVVFLEYFHLLSVLRL